MQSCALALSGRVKRLVNWYRALFIGRAQAPRYPRPNCRSGTSAHACGVRALPEPSRLNDAPAPTGPRWTGRRLQPSWKKERSIARPSLRPRRLKFSPRDGQSHQTHARSDLFGRAGSDRLYVHTCRRVGIGVLPRFPINRQQCSGAKMVKVHYGHSDRAALPLSWSSPPRFAAAAVCSAHAIQLSGSSRVRTRA